MMADKGVEEGEEVEEEENIDTEARWMLRRLKGSH